MNGWLAGWMSHLPIVFSLVVRHHVCSWFGWHTIYHLIVVSKCDAKHRVIQRENLFFICVSRALLSLPFAVWLHVCVCPIWICCTIALLSVWGHDTHYLAGVVNGAKRREMERERSQKDIYLLFDDSTSHQAPNSSDRDIHVYIIPLLSSTGKSGNSAQKKRTVQHPLCLYYLYFSFASDSKWLCFVAMMRRCICSVLLWCTKKNEMKKANEQIVNSLLFALRIGKRQGCQHSQPIHTHTHTHKCALAHTYSRHEQDNIFHYVDLFGMMRHRSTAAAATAGAMTKIKTLRDSFESIRIDLLRFFSLFFFSSSSSHWKATHEIYF